MTPVVFRVFENGEVIALFPTLDHASGNATRDMCMSYMHVGQHGEADYQGVVDATMPADDIQYYDLLEELQMIGYDDLQVVRRAPNGHPSN